MNLRILKAAVVILALFGLLTIFMAGSIIFDKFGIREKEGNYVPFIVWANFICGFLYLIAAYGFIKMQKWTANILIIAFVILIVAFGGLLIYINSGGIYETKTLAAMVFRTAVTLAFALFARRRLSIQVRSRL